MIFAYALVVVASIAGWLHPRRAMPAPPGAEPRSGTDRSGPVAVAAACAALLATFVAALALQDANAFHVVHVGARVERLPIAMVGDGSPGRAASGVALAIGAVQTALLALLAFLVARGAGDRRLRVPLGVASLAALALALWSPVMTSADAYSYVGQARAAHAYRPIPARSDPVGRTIAAAFDGTVAPSPYGPLWVTLSRAAIAPAATLGGELDAMRLLGAAGFVASLLALHRLRLDAAALACFALNPALLQQYVVDGHNDVVALAFALWACAVASLPLAIVLVAAAAAIKLPFALIGALAFARPGALAPRLAAWTCAIAIATGAYLAVAGRDLRYGLDASAHTYTAPGGFFAASHVAAFAVAIAALGVALVARRYVPAAAWSMLAFGFIPVPWYLAGCVPYAARAGRPAAFFVALPLAAAVLSRTFIVDRIADGVVPAVVGTAAILLVAREGLRLARRRQPVRVAASR